MKSTTKQSHWWLTILSLVFLLAGLTACSSTEGSSDENGKPKPEVPVNQDDWQTVPASGGTIEKDDIAIDFPSGTFTEDTEIAISEAQKGKTCGENEVSKFYQITLPVTTNKPFKVKIKCEETGDDIYFVVRSPAFSLSEQEGQYHNYSLEGNYSNGEQTVSIPEADNGSDGETSNLTIGLAHVLRESGGSLTRADHTIKWHFDSSSWTMLWTSQAQLDKLAVLKPIIGGYINDALRIIQGLGFKINEDRDIPICLETGLKSNIYGTFSQDWRKDKNSTIELNQDKILAMGEDRRDLKTTIIHELMHYFQSEYDRRTPYKKAGTGAEELIIYESGAVWVEQFMIDGKLNANFVQQYIYPFGRSLKDLDAVYADDSQVKGSYRVYQDHGYAMSTLLSYVTKQTWADFSNQSIVELHEIWNKYWSPFTCLDVWFSKHSYGLLAGCEYDDFILELAQGNIPSDGSSPIDANMLAYNSSGTLKGDGKIDNMSGSCLIYGTDCKKVNLSIPKDIDLSNKQIIIRQENEGVHTYTYIKSTKGNKFYKTPVTPNSPLTISANDLDQMRNEEGTVKALLFTLSTNIENSSTLPSNVSVEITGEEDNGNFRVNPDEVRFLVEGGTELVTIEKGSYKYCGVDVPETYQTWLSAQCSDNGTVTITATRPNMSFDERKGEVICWVSNEANPQDAKKKTKNVSITQDPVTGVDWSPKSLSFTANGGSEKISFEFGGFKRFGAQVHEEGYEWCGVSAANGKLTITVQPNPSNESRECIVDAYVTNSSSPAEDEKLIMPITVFQEGGDGTVAANNLTDLWGTWVYRYNQHDWDLDYAVTFGKDGSYYYVYTDNKNPGESFTRTGTYKVLSHEPWNTPSADGVIGLAEIEESFHNSSTGNDVVRQWTITLYNNGQLGYENKLWRAAQ